MLNQAVIGALDRARLARGEARPQSVDVGLPALLRKGIVRAVTGSTYTVAVYGDDGEPVSNGETELTYTRVRPVFADAGTLAEGDPVILVFWPGETDQPEILNDSGDYGAFFQGWRDLGFWQPYAD